MQKIAMVPKILKISVHTQKVQKMCSAQLKMWHIP